MDQAPSQQRLWNETPQARQILATLTPQDVWLRPHTPAVGPRCYRWSAGRRHQALSTLRRAAVERHFGSSFAAANRESRARAHAYLALDRLQPGVGEVLAARFGDPAQFGPCPASSLYDLGTHAHRAKAHVAELLGDAA